MEIVYLLCSILSACISSVVLSLLLPFRCLLRRVSASDDTRSFITLYQGTVWHERRRPVHHSFQYTVRYALIDLDGAIHAPPDHLSADEARRTAETNGPVFLLTIPPSVGYEQNPLNLYYCYDIESSGRTLRKCIAEDMLGNWSMKASDPGDNLHVVISVQHPELGNYFTASLTAKRVPPSSSTMDHSRFFWLMPHRVALWIYWHALKLWWKNVAFIQHPRYDNPAYRQEALLRDKNIRHCPSFSNDTSHNLREHDSEKPQPRCFTWQDAPWPWS
ncbi:uncharacterized protein LOC127247468 isoform X2 [Andrographis paniculata]|uniref:uncharacterized protein LOC127247468 isoform X2 n=1 Tax=Andrographis paniculata TaxID=175694 RepID=UPI0021E732D4|nr:uncharacterized protein LOC127247468 isoform X2 [Andrographis paniculata]